MAAGRAIKFLAKREDLIGVLRGSVRNASHAEQPLPGATVAVLENGHEYVTGPDGRYEGIEDPGSYTLVASCPGFASDTLQAVPVSAGGSTEADFLLHDILAPSVALVDWPVSTPDSLGPYTFEASVVDISGLEEVSVYWRTYDQPFRKTRMAPGMIVNRFAASLAGQPWTTRIDWYVYARDGGGNVTMLPAGGPEDPASFWVGPLLSAYANDFEPPAGDWTVGSPEDGATAGLWEQADPNGTFHDGTEPVQPEDDHTPDAGVLCWVTGNAPAGSDEEAGDVDGGATTLVSPRLDLAIDGTVLLRYWRWFTNDTGGASGDEWLVQVSNDDGHTWVDVERTTASLRSWLQVEVELGALLPLTDQMRVRFRATDVEAPSIVEAAVDDIEIVYIGLTPGSVAEETAVPFGFAALTNPVRPGGVVRFGLDRTGPASLLVFDVQGRAVRRLAEGTLPAGAHAVSWDGRDDGGHALPAGMYFYRLETGGRAASRKVLLTR